MLPRILTQLVVAFGKLTDTLLIAYAALVGWNPVGRSVSITVTEGESEIYGMTVTGVILHVNDFVIIKLNSPWHYQNRTTVVADLVLVQARFNQHTVYRLLLGSWHGHVFPIVDMDRPTAFADKDVIALCVVRLLSQRRAKRVRL